MVLLFWSETLVVTLRLKKALARFRHWAVWHMAGMGTKYQMDGAWVYPLIGEVLAAVGLDEIKVYIAHS